MLNALPTNSFNYVTENTENTETMKNPTTERKKESIPRSSLKKYRQRKYTKNKKLLIRQEIFKNNQNVNIVDLNSSTNPKVKITRREHEIQLKYINKLKRILQRVEPGAKYPTYPEEQDDEVETPIGLTIQDQTAVIAPNQTQFLNLECIDPDEVPKGLYSVAGVSRGLKSIGDGTLYEGKCISLQFSNWSDEEWLITKGEVVARGRRILYRELPKLESLNSDDSGEILNNVSNPLPSEESNALIDQKIAKLRLSSEAPHHSIAAGLDACRSVFVHEDPGDAHQVLDTSEVNYEVKSNAPTIIGPNYCKRFNRSEQEAIDIYLRNGLASGMIEKVPSARYISPLLVVKKPMRNGETKQKYRIIVDMRKVNDSILKKLSFYMPTFEEHINSFSGCNYFSTFDIRGAFHRLSCGKETRDICCFLYNGNSEFQGLFRFTNLTQGAAQSPMKFVNKIREALSPLMKDGNIVFHVDDLLIGSTSLEQHAIDLIKFLKLAKKINLTLDIKKSEIATTDIEWCGYRFHDGKVSPAPSRLTILDTFCFPCVADNKPESRAYKRSSGFLQHHRKFVPKYSHLAARLNELVETAWDPDKPEITPIKVQSECDTITRKICQHIKDSALVIVGPEDELGLRTDASTISYAFELFNRKTGQPICFGGKSFSEVERRYPPFCRELLAQKLGVAKCMPYIHIAKNCVVESDNWVTVRNLQGSSNELDCRALRIILDISTRAADPKIEFKHLAGIKLVVADALSRLQFKLDNNCSNPTGLDLEKINLTELVNFLGENELITTTDSTEQLVLNTRGVSRLKEKVKILHLTSHSAVDKLYLSARAQGMAGRGLFKICSEVLAECEFCHLQKKLISHNILGQTMTPDREMRVLHIDHAHFPLSNMNNQYILTIFDTFSKFFLAVPVPTVGMEPVRLALQTFLLIFADVTSVRGDRAFVANSIQQLTDLFSIDLHFFATHNSRSNSVERAHRTYREKSDAFLLERGLSPSDWDRVNHLVVRGMNQDVSLATKYSPHHVVFNRVPSVSEISQNTDTVVKERRIEIREKIVEEKEKRMSACDIPRLQVGDQVIIKYDAKSKNIPAIVISDDGGLTCSVKKPDTHNQHRIIRCAKRFLWIPKTLQSINLIQKLI